jgi:hypothetical protein
MPVRCIVRNCTSVQGKGLSLFEFPGEPTRRKLWLDALDLRVEQLPQTALVCMLHFPSGMLNDTGSKIFLKSYVVPRIEPYGSDDSTVSIAKVYFFTPFRIVARFESTD